MAAPKAPSSKGEAGDPGTDLATVGDTSTELVLPANVAEYLASAESIVVEDPEQVAFEIVARILSQDTVEGVLNKQQVLSAEAMLGIHLRVTEVRWHRSAYDQREQVYALVKAFRSDNGDEVLITCGGRNVMAQLWKLEQLGALPCDLLIGRSNTPTAGGYWPLWLEPVPTPL